MKPLLMVRKRSNAKMQRKDVLTNGAKTFAYLGKIVVKYVVKYMGGWALEVCLTLNTWCV